MNLKLSASLSVCLILAFLFLPPVSAQEMVRILPEVTDEVLINPGIGFQTFQHFNGDSLFPGTRWSEHGPLTFSDKIKTLENKGYPQTSIAYCRWFWNVLEPKKGEYAWDIIDNALLTAHRHQQTLIIRFMPQKRSSTELPEWYMAEAGGSEVDINKRVVWQPDYTDPKFLEYWGALIRESGLRYDGHPWVEAIDLGGLGYWGEWHTYDNNDWMPPMDIKEEVIDLYLESYKRSPLLMLIGDTRGMQYANAGGAGWRADCLGDLDLWGPEHFPWYITESKATDVWKRAMVVFETCGTYGSWFKHGVDVDRIHQEALRWHISSLNAKSSRVPAEWMPNVEEFMKRMGYRFELRKFEYPSVVTAGQMMPIQMWWVNVGSAPPYRKYQLAIQLKGANETTLIRVDTDVTKWLPNDDIVLEDPLWVPDVAPGIYEVRVGLLDPFTGEPAVKLPIVGRLEDNWHHLGEIELIGWELE